jgi:AcrR family transcriptional regulator
VTDIATDADADAAADTDGRRLRREQNREGVLDALMQLFEEGTYQPSANEIAQRAGLSPRSLFRYFDDIDDLNRAAIDRHLAAARPLLDIGVGPDAPTAEKIDRLVDARVSLFEAIGPAARAARVCAPRHRVISEQLRENRAYLRNQVARLFAPELGGERAALVPTLDAVCAFETYDLLRSDQRLSRTKTVAALVRALTSLLGPLVAAT